MDELPEMDNPYHGLQVIDKPAGMTSRDAVDRAQRWFPKATRIGHTGTLDPLATGVLVLCIGVATRLAEYVQAMKKTYRAGFILGARSNTDDADGILTPALAVEAPDERLVAATLKTFEGDQDQVPPAFSAAKVTGRRAYKLARQGLSLELQPRRVTIYQIAMLAYRFPNLAVEIECGKGTYVRALARDLGECLGCGAYVNILRRTRVGVFHVAEAISFEASAAEVREGLQPIERAVAELPRVVVATDAVALLRQGQFLAAVTVKGEATSETDCAAFDPSGVLVAVVRRSAEDQRWSPTKVLKV